MKIGNPLDPVVGGISSVKGASEETGSSTHASSKSGHTAAAAPQSTTVKISSAAHQLLSSTTNSSAEFNDLKVAQVRQSIDDGTYQINHGAIADKLIANAQELLTQVQR